MIFIFIRFTLKFKRDGNKLGRGSWKAEENERHMHTFMADDVVDALCVQAQKYN